MLEVIVEPGVRRSPEDFLSDPLTLWGIALDGYVINEDGEPWYVPRRFGEAFPRGPRACLDHHKTVHKLGKKGMRSLYRMVTSSTQIQVHDAIKGGMLNGFRMFGEPVGKIFVLESDPDVTMSVFQLLNYQLLEYVKTPEKLTNLLYVNDHIDRSAQGYPFDLKDPRQELNNWLFENHFRARMNGGLRNASGETLKEIISAGCERIGLYLDGHEESRESNWEYEPLAEGPGWIVIREIGPQARAYLFKVLGKELVFTYAPNGNGRAMMTGVKRNPFVDYGMEHLFEQLNRMEGLSEELPKFRWGGSSDSGGSGKIGTSLGLEEIAKVIPRFQGSMYGT